MQPAPGAPDEKWTFDCHIYCSFIMFSVSCQMKLNKYVEYKMKPLVFIQYNCRFVCSCQITSHGPVASTAQIICINCGLLCKPSDHLMANFVVSRIESSNEGKNQENKIQVWNKPELTFSNRKSLIYQLLPCNTFWYY